MVQEHVSDDIIINQIRSSGAAFHLTCSDICCCKQNGVSDTVILEMQATTVPPFRLC